VHSDQTAVFQAQLKAMNMTQVQLASQLGMTVEMLSNILSIVDLEDDWVTLLDALDLEVVIRHIPAEESESTES